MYDHYKEAAWPDTYRREAMKCLTSTLALQRSVRVAGLNGMGKSNLLRFLVSHPRLLAADLGVPVGEVCFIYIDGNRLSPVTSLTFYREANFWLQPDNSPPTITDEYVLHKQFELALRSLGEEMLVILVIDQVERLYANVGREFFDQLRNLRDEARAGRMLFIFGSRKPVGELYELEKLFIDTCWVGPLAEADQALFFDRHQQRLNFVIADDWRQILWGLSGGHPGLLKNSVEWLRLNQAKTAPPEQVKLIEMLLRHEPIEKYCHRLWEDLTQPEKEALRMLPAALLESEAGQLLRHSGLVGQAAERLRVFSPLWETYLRQHIWPTEASAPLRIDLDEATRRVELTWGGQTVETIITRPLVFELLRVLANSPGQIFSKDALINALYQEDKTADVYDDALFQLVTALRKAIDPPVRQLCPAIEESCLQSFRGVGYRLRVDLP